MNARRRCELKPKLKPEIELELELELFKSCPIVKSPVGSMERTRVQAARTRLLLVICIKVTYLCRRLLFRGRFATSRSLSEPQKHARRILGPHSNACPSNGASKSAEVQFELVFATITILVLVWDFSCILLAFLQASWPIKKTNKLARMPNSLRKISRRWASYLGSLLVSFVTLQQLRWRQFWRFGAPKHRAAAKQEAANGAHRDMC